MLRVLDLFSGIGGFSLGLERTGGFRTIAFCESDAFCRKVLAKHWPEVPCYDDIQTLTADRLTADGLVPDVLCGGFPCQDISLAGAGAGITGKRSGLWSEYARLIGELRPRYALVENVAALRARGLGTVLGDLATLGYDAEWHCIPASAVGAPHERDRVWIVAHSPQHGRGSGWPRRSAGEPTRLFDTAGALAHSTGDGCGQMVQSIPSGERNQRSNGQTAHSSVPARCGWWTTEPSVGRVAHGVPHRVHRLRALGNAVVPQAVELLGRAILNAHQTAQERA